MSEFRFFFAGTCFAILFEKRERADIAFGWNLIGAVIGGLTEFLTMAVGFKALLLLTITIYLLAFLFHLREKGIYKSTQTVAAEHKTVI